METIIPQIDKVGGLSSSFPAETFKPPLNCGGALPLRGIGGRLIGPGRPSLLTAEIGGNHGGRLELAEAMVRAAAECGADAVKFQAYHTAEFLSRQSPYYDELAGEELPQADLTALAALARKLGLAFGLTVFDAAGLDLAAECQADFIKISSGDLTHHGLLAMAAKAERPLFVSTGGADESEVRAALKILAPARPRLVLMQCASLYPAPLESANLAVMESWQRQGLAAGYSDHTLGLAAAKAAMAMGAAVVEKHFTIDRELPGGDNSISATPEEMAELAQWARLAAQIRGRAVKEPQPDEMAVIPLIRRAVVAAGDIEKGARLTPADLALKRPPAAGAKLLPPDALPGLIGRRAGRKIAAGAPLRPEDLEDHNG